MSFFAAVKSRVVHRKSFIVFTVLCLFTIYHLLFTSLAFAQGAPDPQPCSNVQSTDKLTDNYVAKTNDKGDVVSQFPPFPIEVSGKIGETKEIPIPPDVDNHFTMDVSQLQGIFGAPNSDYLEAPVQDSAHRSVDVYTQNKQDFNSFHGPDQKIAPKEYLDQLKADYVKYVYEHPKLAESGNKFTDLNGQNPKTIYDLVNSTRADGSKWGLPNPPDRNSDRTDWLATWGKYWDKIPTAVNEFYKGYMQIRLHGGWRTYFQLREGTTKCPPYTVLRTIEFTVPEFARTMQISNTINRIVMPCNIQSFRQGTNEQENKCGAQAKTASTNQPPSLSQKFINLCRKLFDAPENIAKKLKETIKVGLKILNPVKTAFAATTVGCKISVFGGGKEGVGPYCAIPEKDSQGNNQIQSGDSCQNKISSNKLDQGQNVICAFTFPRTAQITLKREEVNCAEKLNGVRSKYDPEKCAGHDFWDECQDLGNDTYTCKTNLTIYPVYQIPFLAEIWNNTLASDKNAGGVNSYQETGRPGIFANFSPKAILNILFPRSGFDKVKELVDSCTQKTGQEAQSACDELYALISKYASLLGNCDGGTKTSVDNPYFQFEVCVGGLMDKDLPAQAANGNVQGAATSNVLGDTTDNDNAKERFIGGVDCSKYFYRDIALKPKALQQELKISQVSSGCALASSQNAPPSVIIGPPGGSGGGTGSDCGQNSGFASLLPNPIPQSISPDSPSHFSNLASGKVVAAAKAASQATGVACEILVGLHYVETGGGWEDTNSFISGRALGQPEPDVSSAADCNAWGGTMAAGGCIFSTLEQTANYAADLIKTKVLYLTGDAKRPPANFNEMIGAMSYYNGGGNSNCYKGVPYSTPCPPPEGIDDAYAVNRFDTAHAAMYLIYCADFTLCDPPRAFGRDGAATAAKEFFLHYHK